MKKYLFLITILLFAINAKAQEFNCKVNVNADQIPGVEFLRFSIYSKE